MAGINTHNVAYIAKAIKDAILNENKKFINNIYNLFYFYSKFIILFSIYIFFKYFQIVLRNFSKF
jgi:hypothetical protein